MDERRASHPQSSSKACPSAPDGGALRETALTHLARFATTEQGLRQVLERRLRRWGVRASRSGMADEEIEQAIASARPEIEAIVASMIGLGALDDAGFARSRAVSLTRTGRSRRMVEAQLVGKGVEPETVREALAVSLGGAGDAGARDAELAAALVLARKRRLGPFRRPDRPDEDPIREMGIFARNGFSRDVAQSVLDMGADEAEDRIIAFRSL